MIINDEEIKRAEKYLLKEGDTFSDLEDKLVGEKINIIKEMNKNLNVIACPGSGKTTVLLAKLTILADRIPFENNKGLCVLTHTNVAIDEIKNKLGSKSDILFKYPNFFGTIQSFVDKYLAIPYFIKINKKRPKVIDNDFYKNTFIKYLPMDIRNNPNINKRREWENEITNWIFSFDDHNILLKDINGEPVYKTNNNSAKSIKGYKNKIMNDYGILSFSDSYCYAYWYLNEKPLIKNILSTRFKYLFIDETQDTYKHQEKLINEIFDDKKVIIQKFGDPRQAIFDDKNKIEEFDNPQENILEISKSMRFGNFISDILKTVCIIDKYDSLSGNTKIDSVKPHIILFNDDSISKILEKYAELVIKYNIKNKTNKKIKAVGWVGEKGNDQNNEKLYLKKYYKNYKKSLNKSTIKQKHYYNNLLSFLYAIKSLDIKKDVKKCYMLFISIFNKILDDGDIKNKKGYYFSQGTLEDYLKKECEIFYKDFRNNIYIWIKRILKNESVDLLYEDIKNYFLLNIKKIWNNFNEIKCKDFIENKSVELSKEELECNNIYKSEKYNIEIELGTVHSVKGETHAATLYLETFYYDYDSNRIKSFICGEYEKNKIKGRVKENLKIAYVAMSRPTHFLCLALHSERIGCLSCNNKNNCRFEIIEDLIG